VPTDWFETAETNGNILNKSLQRIKHGSIAMTQKYKSKKKKSKVIPVTGHGDL
jgi:hypothetical protein